MATDNKLVKTLLNAATLTGLTTGIGWAAKKAFRRSFTCDSSESFENYAMFTAALAGSIVLKRYLEDQKILPNRI